MTNAAPHEVEEIAAGCLMARVRMIARRVTRYHDDALRPFGIQASQLNLLVFVARFGPVRRSRIGKILGLDPSTLTRNLRVMTEKGWIGDSPDDADGRARLMRATPAGLGLIVDVAPAWRTAQATTRALLGVRGESLVWAISGNAMRASAGTAVSDLAAHTADPGSSDRG